MDDAPGEEEQNSVVLVRKRTIPTEGPQPVGEVSRKSFKNDNKNNFKDEILETKYFKQNNLNECQ
jgi:hypothetical protein